MEMARIFLTVLFVVVVGCGSGDHQTVVTISPRPSTVALGTSVTFTAAIQPDRVPLGVNWTLEITSAWSSAGSITGPGPYAVGYTAPTSGPPPPSSALTQLKRQGA